MLHNGRSAHVITEQNEIPPKAAGSFAQSYITSIIAANVGRAVIGLLNAPIAAMKDLSPMYRGLLAVASLSPGFFIPIPLTRRVHFSGGKNEVSFMLGLSLAGLGSLTALSAGTDLSTIDSFDLRLAILLGSGVLIGQAGAAFQLIIDVLKWAPKSEQIPNLQLLHALLVDSSCITTPIIVFFLKPWGFFVPYSVFTGILLITLGITVAYFQASPFNQFRSKYSFDEASELAIASGQLESTLVHSEPIALWTLIKANLVLLKDRRGLILNLSIFTALGSFILEKTFLSSILAKGFGFSPEAALGVTVASNLLIILARPAATLITSKWDQKSGGVNVHLAGCALTIITGLSLAIFDLPFWAVCLCIMPYVIGCGIIMATPMSLAIAWSNPANKHFDNYNPSPMFTLFNSLGGLGGIVLPLVLTLLLEEQGNPGFKNYFFIIAAMMLISAIGVPIINHQVQNKRSCFKNGFTFFAHQSLRQDDNDPIEEAEAGVANVVGVPPIYLERTL